MAEDDEVDVEIEDVKKRRAVFTNKDHDNQSKGSILLAKDKPISEEEEIWVEENLARIEKNMSLKCVKCKTANDELFTFLLDPELKTGESKWKCKKCEAITYTILEFSQLSQTVDSKLKGFQSNGISLRKPAEKDLKNLLFMGSTSNDQRQSISKTKTKNGYDTVGTALIHDSTKSTPRKWCCIIL